jgi:hypothetical protein
MGKNLADTIIKRNVTKMCCSGDTVYALRAGNAGKLIVFFASYGKAFRPWVCHA